MRSFGAGLVTAALMIFLISPVDAAVDPAAATQQLSDKRTAAVLAKNKAAFLETIAATATPEFKTAQSQLFDGLASLPLGSLKATITTRSSGDLSVGLALKNKYGADSVYLPETRLTYRLGDYDDRDAFDSYWYTYVEQDGHWLVQADNDASVIGLTGTQELWDRGAVTTASNDRVLVVTSPANAARGRDLLNIANSAARRTSTNVGRCPGTERSW